MGRLAGDRSSCAPTQVDPDRAGAARGAASFVPDVALLASRFIPGTTTAGVLALMTMHLVVIVVAVPAYILASRGA